MLQRCSAARWPPRPAQALVIAVILGIQPHVLMEAYMGRAMSKAVRLPAGSPPPEATTMQAASGQCRYTPLSTLQAATDKVGVLLLNLGGPDRLEDVEKFLFNLFNDPDIIRLPPQGKPSPVPVLSSR